MFSRIGRNHLGGNIYGSTFRWTLAALLKDALSLIPVGRRVMEAGCEDRLSSWMREHLDVAVAEVEDRSILGGLETEALLLLDPPLNLQKMPPTTIRQRLSQRRSEFGRRQA